jgi:hypothetical protein
MNITKSLFIALVAGLAIASCESDEQTAQPSDNAELSQSAQEFLSMKMGIAPLTSFSSRDGGAVSKSFQQLGSARAASGRMRADTIGGDTTAYVTCAEISTVYNPDGSITTVVDYGHGCEEGFPPYLQFLFGKYVSTSKNDISFDGTLLRNSYYYNNLYKHFGGRYSVNGEEYEWVTDGESTDDGYLEVDSTNNIFNGEFNREVNITYVWGDQTYKEKGSSTTTYTYAQSVVEQSDFTYETNDDYYYRVKVLEPLVTKFDCQQNPDTLGIPQLVNTYVSGVEAVHYKVGSEQGSFEIHYGNGECDSIITIVEKGKRKKVDLSSREFTATKND